MIHTPYNCEESFIVDATGNKLPWALSFDDETFEVTFLVQGANGKLLYQGTDYTKGFDLVKATAVIQGARLVNKKIHESGEKL